MDECSKRSGTSVTESVQAEAVVTEFSIKHQKDVKDSPVRTFDSTKE